LQTTGRGEFNWDSVPPSTVGSRPPINPVFGRNGTSPHLPTEPATTWSAFFKETGSGVRLDRAERRKVMALAQARGYKLICGRPPPRKVFLQYFDQIACVHMSGLLVRSHMNAGQDGFRDKGSKQTRDLVEGHWA